MDDIEFSKRHAAGFMVACLAVVVAVGLLARMPHQPQLPAPTATAQSTPAPTAIQSYRARLAVSVETIAREVAIISASVQLAGYDDPAWQATVTESAASLQAACNGVIALDPPVHMLAVHGNATRMAERFRAGARLLLRNAGHVNGATLDAVAFEFGRGTQYLEAVAGALR